MHFIAHLINSIDGKKCEEILVKSTALKERLGPMIENYKRELMINQIFQLNTPSHEIKIDQIFGSFDWLEMEPGL